MATTKLSSSHSPASHCANEARFGAALTVIVFMLFALIPASFANVRTDAAQFFGVRAVQGHRLRSECTKVGTFPVQPNAFFHLRDMFFLKTSVETVIARLHTAETLFNASLNLLVRHR
jgi:hypothetical protein